MRDALQAGMHAEQQIQEKAENECGQEYPGTEQHICRKTGFSYLGTVLAIGK